MGVGHSEFVNTYDRNLSNRILELPSGYIPKKIIPRQLKSGFVAAFLHYSMVPGRDDAWLKKAANGLSKAAIEKEYDGKLISIVGKPFFNLQHYLDNQGYPILSAAISGPVPGRKYVIGADCSGGEADPACGIVIDPVYNNQVNIAHGLYSPRAFAEVLYAMGMFYNKALIGIEMEKFGGIVLTKLEDMRYPNLYYREKKKKVNFGNRQKTVIKPGWDTNSKTRIQMLTGLYDVLDNGLLGVASQSIIYELQSFVTTKDGKPEADSGYFDDCVMSLAIAFELSKLVGGTLDVKDINLDLEFGDNIISYDTPISVSEDVSIDRERLEAIAGDDISVDEDSIKEDVQYGIAARMDW